MGHIPPTFPLPPLATCSKCGNYWESTATQCASCGSKSFTSPSRREFLKTVIPEVKPKESFWANGRLELYGGIVGIVLLFALVALLSFLVHRNLLF